MAQTKHNTATPMATAAAAEQWQTKQASNDPKPT